MTENRRVAAAKVIVKSFIKALAFFGLLYLLFHYLGEFSERQSLVLTIVSWAGYGLYEQLKVPAKIEAVFTPFHVSFHPNWYELLMDFKLIKNKEDWQRLCEAADKLPASQFRAFNQGFSFTVIKGPSDEGLLPGLTFWDNRKIFLTELELSEPIIEKEGDRWAFGKFNQKHELFDHPCFGDLPRVVFRWGINGYELGLEVYEKWWKEYCESGELRELAKIKVDTDYRCGTTRLVIATLPYSEFDVYYQPNDFDRLAKLRVEWNQKLEANGWKRKEEDKDAEITDPWYRVEHKYFSVSHRSI